MKSPALDLVLVAVEEVVPAARGHVEAVLLVVDLDEGEPDAGVEDEQGHREVERRVADGEELAAAEAGQRWSPPTARPRGGPWRAPGASRPGRPLVAALDDEEPRAAVSPASTVHAAVSGR